MLGETIHAYGQINKGEHLCQISFNSLETKNHKKYLPLQETKVRNKTT